MKERKQSYFKKVGKSLPKIIDKNIKKRNFVEIALIKKWKEIIGQDIAKYCWPIKIVYSDIKNSNGIIFLKTKRGRSMEIEFKNDEIIEKPVSSEKKNGDEVITRVLEIFDGEILR